VLYDFFVRRIGTAALLIFLATLGCSKEHLEFVAPPFQPWFQTQPPLPMPSLTVSQLLAAPDTLVVEGKALTAAIYLNRDFMPFSPPEERPLAAFARLNSAPPDSFPTSVSDVYVWVIRDSTDVWAAAMTLQYIDAGENGARHYFAGGGPLWDPGLLANVVIGVRTSPSSVSLALFRDVPIQRSD